MFTYGRKAKETMEQMIEKQWEFKRQEDEEKKRNPAPKTMKEDEQKMYNMCKVTQKEQS